MGVLVKSAHGTLAVVMSSAVVISLVAFIVPILAVLCLLLIHVVIWPFAASWLLVMGTFVNSA